jgi:hypothetical protein
MTDFNALFKPQADAFFKDHPEALYCKVFYLIRDMNNDPDPVEQSYFGQTVVSIRTIDYLNYNHYPNESSISAGDLAMLSQYLYRPTGQKFPELVTVEFDKNFPVR